MKATTAKEAVAKLLLNHHTPRDTAAIAGVSLSYAQDIRRGLVFEGKLPRMPGRGRPRKERAA